MQKVLTAAQMREVDRLTTERYGIPSILLMENAAHAVVRVIIEELGGSVKGKLFLILCGPGNNGGDGAAIARLLAADGASIRLILFAKTNQTKGDARINFERLPPEVEVCEAEEWWQAWDYVNTREWNELACVVDAVFGTGLKYYRDDLNEIIGGFSDALHVSVDIPSGLMADTADVQPTQFRTDLTVALTAPKLANIVPPAADVNGELIIAEIGSPQELIAEQTSQLFLAERSDAVTWLKRTEFASDSYKNKRGHALIVAGSEDYSGAAVLAGNAAMRSGIGLVTLACPVGAKSEIASRLLPEVILSTIESGEFSGHIEKADAIAVGCGLDANDPEMERLIREIAATRTKPVIVDAGALRFFSPVDDTLQKPARSKGTVADADGGTYDVRTSATAPLILTPHEGEFLRLLGTDDKGVLNDRVAAVRDFATKNDVILVLKGERVLIGHPDGRVVVNPTGNSGLGKAGNGDTLTGILAGFVAQAVRMDIDIFETVVAAVYVAGMAGDIAEKKYGKRVMTASDVRECLVEVFTELGGK